MSPIQTLTKSRNATARVLVVHPDRETADGLVAKIRRLSDDLAVESAQSIESATEQVPDFAPSVVLLDGLLLASVSDTIAKEFCDNGARVVVLAETLTADLITAAIAAGCDGLAFSQNAADRFLDVDPNREPGAEPHNPLTRRQRQVLKLIAEGLSTPDIAARLFISRNTARNHVRQVLERLGAHSKLEAVTVAVRQGLVEIK